MPKGVRKCRFELPPKLKLEYIKGEKFLEMQAVSKLAGLPAPVIEMGQRLLKSPDEEGGVFMLVTQEMKDNAPQIEAIFTEGLTRIARLFGPKGTKVRSFRDDDRCVWYYQLKRVRNPVKRSAK